MNFGFSSCIASLEQFPTLGELLDAQQIHSVAQARADVIRSDRERLAEIAAGILGQPEIGKRHRHIGQGVRMLGVDLQSGREAANRRVGAPDRPQHQPHVAVRVDEIRLERQRAPGCLQRLVEAGAVRQADGVGIEEKRVVRLAAQKMPVNSFCLGIFSEIEQPVRDLPQPIRLAALRSADRLRDGFLAQVESSDCGQPRLDRRRRIQNFILHCDVVFHNGSGLQASAPDMRQIRSRFRAARPWSQSGDLNISADRDLRNPLRQSASRAKARAKARSFIQTG